MVRNVVENYVVAFRAFGEILFRVIDDVIRAERSHKIDILRTADTGHIRAERLGDLHREGSHTSRRAVDQDLLTGLNFSLITKRLQSGDARDVDRSRLFKSDASGFQCDCALGAPTYKLGKGASSSTENIIAWFELSNILTDRFDRSGKVNAQT